MTERRPLVVQPLLLVVVTGPPASGKTTLAQELARGLRVTVLSKDTFKETLYEVFGSGEEVEGEIERAGLALLAAAAKQQLESSLPVIVESDFDRAGDEDLLRRLVIDHEARLLQVHCDTPSEEVVERFRRRAASGERHPGHGDQPQDAASVEHQLRAGRWEPLELDAPLLRTQADETASVLEWVEARAREEASSEHQPARRGSLCLARPVTLAQEGVCTAREERQED